LPQTLFVNLLQALTKYVIAGSLPMNRKRILVVDNDKGTARYVCGYLEEFRYEALVAHDGETALQTIRCEKPDLVVLELTLPDQNGLEVIRAVRSDPCLCRLPIIIHSARGAESDRLFGLELGADDYLAKPFNRRELVARVHAVLRRSYRQNTGTNPLPWFEKENNTRIEQ
jgi:two-component system alkaline phosphatase synthesis response regulator PhoP